MKTILAHAFTACISVFITLILWQTLLEQPSIVSFDMKKTVKSFSTQLAQSSLTPETKKKLSVNFTKALVTESKAYAKANNVIVIVSPAIISGSVDATHSINQMVQQKLTSIDISGV